MVASECNREEVVQSGLCELSYANGFLQRVSAAM